MQTSFDNNRICLIAGNGQLPVMLTENAIKEGVDVFCFAVTSEAYRNLKRITPTFKFALTDAFAMIDKAKELGITHGTSIGKIPKLEFFKNIHKLDPKIVAMLTELINLNDDSLHNFLVDKLENEYGFKFIEQTRFLQELFPAAQIFSKRKPTDDEMSEINYGMAMAKELARLDVGQTAVIQNKSVIAFEAIEGTDECIKRAKKLVSKTKNKNITVCKVSKPNQDQRFDIPTVGWRTIKQAGSDSIIAFEANETFFINEAKLLDYVDEHNICLLAV